MKPTTDPNRIDEALQELLRLVAEGWEFPDAAWRVASRKSVQYDALVAAYDEHCATH